MNNMTPLSITDNQIGKLNDLLSAKLRKAGLQKDPVQQVLENQGKQLAKELLAVVRRYVDLASEMISRWVTVDRSLNPKQALEATGRKLYVDDQVVQTMPNSKVDKVEVFFFKLDRWISDDDLEKEYEKRGRVPCDPYTLAKVNQDDSAFADDHPNCTHWKDKDGNWCFAAFGRWDGERHVNVGRSGSGWCGCWWFAGVRK